MDPLDPLYLGADKLTNNTGELSAIAAALRWTLNLLGRARPFEVGTVRIVSDSQYALDAATCKWRSNLANGGLVKRLQGLLRQAKERVEVVLDWTKAHTGLGTQDAHWNQQAQTCG